MRAVTPALANACNNSLACATRGSCALVSLSFSAARSVGRDFHNRLLKCGKSDMVWAMATKSKPKPPDDPEQYKRFLEAAKEAEADETAKGADKAFKAVVKPRKPKS